MTTKLLIIILIFLLDIIFFYALKSQRIDGADHSSFSHVIIFQIIAVLDVLVSFKISKFFLESLGVYRKHREYVVVILILLFSYLSFHTAIIGTDEWGKPCDYPSCIEKANSGTLERRAKENE